MLSVLGFFVGVGLLILPFAFGWIGAGDVKYLGVIGALSALACCLGYSFILPLSQAHGS
jgi:prepilin peptidase CpaA